MIDLLEAAENRMRGILQGKQYPAASGVTLPLEVYLVEIPPKRDDPLHPEVIPYCLITVGDGSGGPLMPRSELFAVQFVFHAVHLDGRPDKMAGIGYISETHAMMEAFCTPFELGDWELVAVSDGKMFEKFYGADGEFLGPNYSVQYIFRAVKRANNCEVF